MTTTTITIENFTDEELRIEIPDVNPAINTNSAQYVSAKISSNKPGVNAVAFARPTSGKTLTIYRKGTTTELKSIDVKESQTLEFRVKGGTFTLG